MDVNFSKQGDWTIIAVEGRMDTVSAPEFEKMVQERILQGSNRLIVDFSKLDYISSAGLRSILVAGKNSKAKGGELACCGLQGVVKKVFDVSGFHKLLPIFDSKEDVLNRE
ncbi:MAG: STAS domain-containing protein [Desulfomonile tiedjei]|uniref:Anti-sigma factor antagonist n=1 Tax=Desulfomonile tiedjei TaxID=2358 RepID=A0A9D6UZL2_9BACT|nr:STAS domain-containing protein [Desulfomonile tiedjei]